MVWQTEEPINEKTVLKGGETIHLEPVIEKTVLKGGETIQLEPLIEKTVLKGGETTLRASYWKTVSKYGYMVRQIVTHA